MASITDKETVNKVYAFLGELGCCPRCILRFLGVHISENEGAYKAPEDFFAQFEIRTAENGDNECTKKIKRNCCPACLNCFNLAEIENFAEKIRQTDIHEYNYNTYMLNISFPKCFVLRTYSIFLYLKKQFPTVPFFNIKRNEEPGLEQPHKIFRLISSKILRNVLDKEYSPKSNVTILIVLGYENDEMEIKSLEPPSNKKPKKKRFRHENKKPKAPVSRNEILEIVKNVNNDQFKKYYPIPPDIPNKGVFLEDVTILTDPIFLGGRYLKFKRNVGQTPWIIDGVSLSEHNIQEILFNAIQKITGIEKSQMTFTSSGREDVDVRMLGLGRPFYIKIDKSKNYRISDEDLLKIQEEIVKTELAAVIKLQHVYASETNRIKAGEEEKRKTYRALCHTKAPNLEEVVRLINQKTEGVDIVQTTALRVLHRRTLMPRERRIYSMSAKAIEGRDNVFELEMETQAGTYVKEFVHGDFGRTIPSISSIVGHPTDIIALDCIDVHLDWPEETKHMGDKINENNHKNVNNDIVKNVQNEHLESEKKDMVCIS